MFLETWPSQHLFTSGNSSSAVLTTSHLLNQTTKSFAKIVTKASMKMTCPVWDLGIDHLGKLFSRAVSVLQVMMIMTVTLRALHAQQWLEVA